VGELGNSELVARRLGLMHMSNAASPAYLAARGTPHTLADLAGHRVVHYTPGLTSSNAGWEYFDRDAGAYKILAMPAALSVNGTDAYQAAALAGLGMIQAPTLGLGRLFERGALVPVMPGFTASPMPVSLLYANRRHLAPRVEAVMAWLTTLITPYLVDPP
jgi:DNA-binding transcriptional LysR family regulator